jgi:hypothetical protein
LKKFKKSIERELSDVKYNFSNFSETTLNELKTIVKDISELRQAQELTKASLLAKIKQLSKFSSKMIKPIKIVANEFPAPSTHTLSPYPQKRPSKAIPLSSNQSIPSLSSFPGYTPTVKAKNFFKEPINSKSNILKKSQISEVSEISQSSLKYSVSDKSILNENLQSIHPSKSNFLNRFSLRIVKILHFLLKKQVFVFINRY